MGNNLLVPENELTAAFPKMTLERALKHGGQKNTFLVQHENYGSAVLKVFSPEMERGRVYREIGIGQRNLVRIPQVYSIDDKTFSTGTFFVAFEQRVDGEDMTSYFKKNGPINYAIALQLVKDVLEILVALEREGVVHRDIKPDNIILDRKGRFWLVDFGAARDLSAKTLTVSGNRAPLTYGYAAPEQYDSSMRDLIDSRTDLFSLGVTVYTLLRGKNPFVQCGRSEYEIAVTTQRYHATTLQIKDDINNGLAKFIKLLMNKDIGARPISASAALGWIDKFVAQEIPA